MSTFLIVVLIYITGGFVGYYLAKDLLDHVEPGFCERNSNGKITEEKFLKYSGLLSWIFVIFMFMVPPKK